jgi:hypothetical protein
MLSMVCVAIVSILGIFGVVEVIINDKLMWDCVFLIIVILSIP